MLRLLVVFLAILAMFTAAARVVAQGENPCPAVERFAATPGASPVASPVGSPTSEPTKAPTVAPTASPVNAVTCDVAIQDFAFEPGEIDIQAGTSIIWTNLDGTIHTATADDDAFDTDRLAQDQASDPIAFDVPGVFPYHCDIHPDFMVGVVRVT